MTLNDSLRDTGATHHKVEVSPSLPVTLSDSLVPLNEDGRYVPNHLDANGVVHWFSVVEADQNTNPNGEPYQMRYYRAAQATQGEIVYDSYPVMPLERNDRSPAPLPTLEIMLEDGDLTNAYALASGTAQLYGLSFPDPTEMPDLERSNFAANALATQFQTAFQNSPYHLLKPVDSTVNYSFEVFGADPWTDELTADKWWIDGEGQIAHDSITLATYSMEWSEAEKEVERERASMDREVLHRTYQEEGLEAAMRRAEGMAVAEGELDPKRVDGRLFRSGPEDRFTTSREAELSGFEMKESGDAIGIASNSESDGANVTIEPGSWEELLQRANPSESESVRHYWQLRAIPVLTPDGTPLGHAVFCTEFPELPPNFDEYFDQYGIDDSIYPTQARTVEIADFKTEKEAVAFSDEFRRHLIPEVIDGPELAPDVAALEGLSGQWEAMDYPAILDYMDSSKTVIREPNQWHLHRSESELQRLDEMDNSLFDIDF